MLSTLNVNDIGDIAICYYVVVFMIILCSIVVGMIGGYYVSKVKKPHILFVSLTSYIVLLAILLVNIINIIKPKVDDVKDYAYYNSYHNRLPLEEWMVDKEGNDYLLISRDTGIIYSVKREDYVRYEVCPNIDIIKYFRTVTYSNVFFNVKSSVDSYAVECYSTPENK